MDGSIIIEGLRVFGHIGVAEQEQLVGNMYDADICLDFSCSQVMESGSLDDTINYAAVVASVRSEMEVPAVLLEEAVGRIYRRLCQEYPAITGGSIALYKTHPPISAELGRVGFRYRWQKNDGDGD